MIEEPEHQSGPWSRLSRRTKLVIAVDLAVLAILLGGAAAYLANSRSDTSATSSATTTTTPIPGSPLKTPRGLAYIAAACGGAVTLQRLPESPLPRADDYAVCVAPTSGAAIAIGVYDDRAALDEDVADFGQAHRFVTHTDDDGAFWLALIEGDSAAPLAPLQRYGFNAQ